MVPNILDFNNTEFVGGIFKNKQHKQLLGMTSVLKKNSLPIRIQQTTRNLTSWLERRPLFGQLFFYQVNFFMGSVKETRDKVEIN
jgi:hypothetical protein